MKTIKLIAALLLSSCFLTNSFAQKTEVHFKKDTIKVWGNCESCKVRIEKAAMAAGASSAVWTPETQQLEVMYNVAVTCSEKIQKSIAKAGHDTQDFKADDLAYNKLPGCCKYTRASATTADKKCTNHAQCSKDSMVMTGMNCCGKTGKTASMKCADKKDCMQMKSMNKAPAGKKQQCCNM